MTTHVAGTRPQRQATLAPGAAPAGAAAWLRRRGAATTPRLIVLAMVALVVASLAWGAIAAWTIGQHASAAQEIVHTTEPLSFKARQMYQSLSDADVTATTAFLGGPDEPLPTRQRFQADIRQAAADLAGLEGSASAATDPQLSTSLAAVSTGLPVYAGYVAQAQSDYALGYQLTGGSFMQVASEQMHLTLLPAARMIYARVNGGQAAVSAQATGLPWIVVTLVISIALWLALYRAQRWLSARTRRTVNLGLLAGTLALTIATLWLIAAFAVARTDLNRAEAHGSTPAQALAEATIAVQGARGDEVLNLISRSGSTSFRRDFNAARLQVGPGSGSLLDASAAASSGNAAATPIAAAGHDARAWYASSAQIFNLDVKSNYRAETRLVVGSGSDSSAAGFTRVENDLAAAIGDDQVVFTSGATSAASAFTGLEIAFVVAALLMAAGCAWGLSRRLAEYR